MLQQALQWTHDQSLGVSSARVVVADLRQFPSKESDFLGQWFIWYIVVNGAASISAAS